MPKVKAYMEKIIPRIKKLFSCCSNTNFQPPCDDMDIREEYANAFRTESYNEFWARVMALTQSDSATYKLVGSISASRLLSYRLFVENLLDPDQPTVTKILSKTRYQNESNLLLIDYFQTTANASTLCGILLKDIDQMRIKFCSIKKSLEFLEIGQISTLTSTSHLPTTLTRLTKLTKSINPFISSSASSIRFRLVKSNCSELLKRLESSRDKVRAKLQLLNGLKHSSAVFLIALTTSLTLLVITHFLVITLAMPSLMIVSLGEVPMKRLVKVSVQLDAATKGTYILNRDLDTIGRLVARLDDELEHIRTTIEFWMDRAEDPFRAQVGEQVARQLKKDESNFIEQLDELEEHLYLCLMTINRARNLVVKEILELHPT